MSHCAPEATLNPKRFEFMPKTVIGAYLGPLCLHRASVLAGCSKHVAR